MSCDCLNGIVLVAEPDPPVWEPGMPTETKPEYPLLHGHGTFRPCGECNPKGYERWQQAAYQRGGRDRRPVSEMPTDYQDEPIY